MIEYLHWLMTWEGMGWLLCAALSFMAVVWDEIKIPSIGYFVGYVIIFVAGMIGLSRLNPTTLLSWGVIILVVTFMIRQWQGRVWPWLSPYLKGRRERIRT